MHDVLEPYRLPPHECPHGCAAWADLAASGNRAPQGAVDALWAQGAVSIVLCWLPGNSLSALMSGVGGASWVYYLGTALALLKLRGSQPDWPRPYRAPMACVWACVAASVLLVASTFFSQPLPTLMALCCCGLAWPARWALAACGCLGKG